MNKQFWKRIIVILTGTALWYAPIPWEISIPAWHLFTLFFSAILAVLLNAFPILISALFAIIIAVFTGTLTAEKAFSGFSENFMLLILAAFLVAKAVIKSGLGRRIALTLIQRFGSSTLRLAYCITATDTLLGPVIPSNTARSGILFPIVNALAIDTGSLPDEATRGISGSYLNMVGMASLTISSALWLTGMAGNFIGVEIAGNFGVEINFLGWFVAASLPCIAAQILLPYALYKFFPPELQKTSQAQLSAGRQIKELGSVSRKEWITAAVFVGMISLWGLSHLIDLNLAIVALLGLAVLLITDVYQLKNLRADGGDVLETYIWFSILYVMSSTLNDLGFMKIIGTQISGLLVNLNWITVYLFLTILYVLIHYLFVSQTAQLLALFAVFLEVGIQAAVPAGLMAFMLLFATNFFSAITPQGSSGNVIFVGSGYLEAKEIYKNGALITLLNLIIFLLATPWILWVSGWLI